ncbi:MAG: hypothetical protein L0H55_14930 [Candidatus Nitrosocosmicus sp.]|nr:hypothetical protein [Candidatus Nitrosocosmicus sp.]
MIGERGESIIVEKGVANEHIYLIPKSKIEAYNGAQIILKVTDQDLQTFEQKSENKDKGESILDNITDKIEDVKDKVIDKTKDVAGKAKSTLDTSTQSSQSSSSNSFNSSNQERTYEEGGPGTEVDRSDNPIAEYRDKEPMTPAKINEHEPTAVKRDPNDQKITSGGQTGTDTERSKEQYRKRGMTKVDKDEARRDEFNLKNY